MISNSGFRGSVPFTRSRAVTCGIACNYSIWEPPMRVVIIGTSSVTKVAHTTSASSASETFSTQLDHSSRYT